MFKVQSESCLWFVYKTELLKEQFTLKHIRDIFLYNVYDVLFVSHADVTATANAVRCLIRDKG